VCVCVDCIQYGTLSCDKQFNHTPRLLLLVCLHSGLGQREIQVIYYLWIDMVEASHAASKLRGELQGSWRMTQISTGTYLSSRPGVWIAKWIHSLPFNLLLSKGNANSQEGCPSVSSAPTQANLAMPGFLIHIHIKLYMYIIHIYIISSYLSLSLPPFLYLVLSFSLFFLSCPVPILSQTAHVEHHRLSIAATATTKPSADRRPVFAVQTMSLGWEKLIHPEKRRVQTHSWLGYVLYTETKLSPKLPTCQLML